MPGYASSDGLVGAQPPNDIFTPDVTQRWPMGQLFTGVDPYFGFGEFIYGKAASAVNPGRLMFPSEVYLMTDIANTAIQGMPFAVARAAFPINTFGWFQVGGVCPIQTVNSVATGVAAGIAAAGQAGTLAAGKQLGGVRVLQASAFTLTKAANTVNGSPVIGVSNVDGLFIGLTISGIGVSGTITLIDPSGRFITVSANSTATGGITATFTYTGFLLAFINRPSSQGAIT